MTKHLSPYRIMWLFVFFDLPSKTAKEKKEYREFRKRLENIGFEMMQYSVYIRWFSTREQAEHCREKIKTGKLPSAGRISIMMVTDKQFSMIDNIWLVAEEEPPKPKQLLLFFDEEEDEDEE